MGARQRLATVAVVWTVGGGLTGATAGVALQPLTVLSAPCVVTTSPQTAGLPACPAGPSIPLLAAELAFLGLLLSAVGLMVMPGMRLDFAEAQALAAAAAQQRALEALNRPVQPVLTYPLALAVR
jgi:hypothetical protein